MNTKFKNTSITKPFTKGFTIIEMVFVIVILGMLASILVPRLVATRDDAEISKIRMQISAIRRGIEYYAAAQMVKEGYDEFYCFTKCDSPRPNDKSNEAANRSKFTMDFLKTRNKGLYPMMLDQSRNVTPRTDDYHLLFKMVLAAPIKGAKNAKEKGWSRINDGNGDPFDGRYFLRIRDKTIVFNYCSPTLYKYNGNMCSNSGKFIPSLNGKFFCTGGTASTTEAKKIADCALVGEEYLDASKLSTMEYPASWSITEAI
ncbi:N-terminal methylation protein [Campylobacter fetus subsp. testudinum]|uniref:type II secretion system protein n=1 Tax=Campylobacter fetus TaxID=196 RepID=UPI00057FA253|nr:prepilin-type N-terminal cleavage/methylation domain-containing protein [Campylobacter fetus]AJB45467.1 N-terminal methylation protein [Campylobacter fetus subsp. testudinum]